MEMSWASRRVGRKGDRRVEDSGGRMVLAGMVDVRGTEPLTAGSGLRRVDMLGVKVPRLMQWSRLLAEDDLRYGARGRSKAASSLLQRCFVGAQ